MNKKILYIFTLLLFIAISVQAQDNSMIEITADEMEWDDSNNKAFAKGNASATQGNRILKATNLIAKMKKQETENGDFNNTIHTIDAKGNVLFIRDGEKAYGNVGLYNVIDEIIILTGNVRVTKGEDIIYGDKLEINLKTGKSRIFSKENKKKVKMKFTPASKNQ